MPQTKNFTKLHFIIAFLLAVGALYIVKCTHPKLNELSLTETETELIQTDTQTSQAEEQSPEVQTQSPTALGVEKENKQTNNSFQEHTPTKIPTTTETTPKLLITSNHLQKMPNHIAQQCQKVDDIFLRERNKLILHDKNGNPVRNKIVSVRSYNKCFNDLNDVQLETAKAIGIRSIEDRKAASQSIEHLVYVGDNPYYDVKPLTHSIPYLVPRAAICLEEIARAFIDSCATKGLPIHKLLLTSVLRTEKDVRRLRRVNLNASENSCHQYGTTFDISYNHFIPIEGEQTTSSLKLKQVLAEVLEDQHQMGTCFIKYEHLRSACFHITAR
ncbi:MAG: hypothetical protein J6R79_02360 [Bacteroidaceae bacterium]|nr:hypothetical protein [Bacteroidaceae bacterium]